ncbi:MULTISPECIES: PA3371 family protein [unclassified Pseudomonas]|uniref:PA3371 family protein n=1 Tax=unclassified Pseudomonas TaxID=196821 RepID=UPI0028D49766|nr:PA3371 family protein [uncultured Pseudomonas sp.]
MSKIAWGLLLMALLSLAFDVVTQGAFGNAPLIAAIVFFASWLVARIIGHRIKFDPQLR